MDFGNTRCLKARQQHGRLYLRAGGRHGERNRAQRSSSDRKGKVIIVASLHDGPESPQRVDNALHGAPRERIVPNQGGFKWKSGQDSTQQASCRPRISRVQLAPRHLKAFQTAAFDQDSRPCVQDRRSKLFKAFQGALTVLAGSKVVDNGGPLGDGANHCQPMADGLVTGYPNSSLDSGRRRDLQALRMVHWTQISMVIDF